MGEDLQQRKGRKPNDEELRDYIHHWTPSQLGNVQEGARQALAAYASSVLEYEEPRILKRALKGGFWRSVWPSMLASFLYTLLLIGAAIILARSGVELIGILRQASGG